MNGEPVLTLRGLGVAYGGVVALDDVSFAVQRGAIVGLIGPNGAGKTSLIDAITGYTAATGQVEINGRDMSAASSYQRVRAGLARTWQAVQLFEDLTAAENLHVAARAASAERWPFRRRSISFDPLDALDALGMANCADLYPRELSHGQRKLVGVARALATRPCVLALDEPAAGLDPTETAVFGDQLRELAAAGTGVLLVDHDMHLVLGVCDDVVVLDFGRLLAHGEPNNIRKDPKVSAAYLGDEMQMEGGPG